MSLSNGKVTPSQMSEILDKLLNDYATETKDKVAAVTEEVADECAKQLQAFDNNGRWKKYPSGWEAKKVSTKGFGNEVYVVWNKKYYFIAHLLEKGYHTRNGNWHEGTPHISTVEQWANENYEKILAQKLGGK